MKARIPSHLSDADLVAEVTRLASGEREATAQLVAHLSELERRKLHLAAGFPSLFAYCTEVLRLSEDAACNRIKTARVARRYPRVLDLLANGSLNVTTVRLLSRYLTDDNERVLIAGASGKSKREVEKLLARQFPRPDVRASVRKVPVPPVVVPPPPIETAPAEPAPTGRPPSSSTAAPRDAPSLALAPARVASVGGPTSQRATVTPLAPERYKVTFTASAETCEKLRRAQDLLRHAIPDGDTAAIFDRALTVLLEDLERRKFAATERPRPSRGTAAASRHIPADVKRAVSERDAGRCVFIGKDGRLCGSRAFLEFHHVRPYAEGGEATVENIRLACALHNRFEAELFYGGVERGWVSVPERMPPLPLRPLSRFGSDGP